MSRQKDYDDDALVLEIARGAKTHAQIAAELRVSRPLVSAIAAGRVRPDLQPRIEAATQGFIDQARRLAARMAAPAVLRLAKLISADTHPTPDVQRKAAVDIVKLALAELPDGGRGGQGDHYLPPGLDLDDAAAFYRWKARQDGRPQE